MKIYRYSDDGFKSQYQDHHYKKVELEFDEDWFNEYLERCPEYLKGISIIGHEERKEFYQDKMDDFKYGIWVFTSKNHLRRSLNHLEIIPQLWEAEIPEDAIAYDVDWKYKKTVSTVPCGESVGCFIPERELSRITNIKKLDNPYQGKSYKDFYKRR